MFLLQIVALCCFICIQNLSTIHSKNNENIFSFICLSVTSIASWVSRYSIISMYFIGYFIYLLVEQVIAILVNGNISKDILTRIARAIPAKIYLKMFNFTRIPIFSLTASCLGLLSSVDCMQIFPWGRHGREAIYQCHF